MVDADEFPQSQRRLADEVSDQIIMLLKEVLPSDQFEVCKEMRMAATGVFVALQKPQGCEAADWTFNNTFGGDDGHTDRLRVYRTRSLGPRDQFDQTLGLAFYDTAPVDAPFADADALEIAQWIHRVVTFDETNGWPERVG
jgi:hypothetical protein